MPIRGGYPGDPIVGSFALQLELLKRARLVITHAGMNKVLEALTQGVPMVAIPITNDQPGGVSRFACSGAGEVISVSELTLDGLIAAILKL